MISGYNGIEIGQRYELRAVSLRITIFRDRLCESCHGFEYPVVVRVLIGKNSVPIIELEVGR